MYNVSNEYNSMLAKFFYCAGAECAIFLLLIKNMTSGFDSVDPICYKTGKYLHLQNKYQYCFVC